MIYKIYGTQLTYNFKLKNRLDSEVAVRTCGSLGKVMNGAFEEEVSTQRCLIFVLNPGELVDVSIPYSLDVFPGTYSAKVGVKDYGTGELLDEEILQDALYVEELEMPL